MTFYEGMTISIDKALQVALHLGDAQAVREFKRRIRNAKKG